MALTLWHVLEVSVFLGHTTLLGIWPPRPDIWLGESRKLPQGSPVSELPRFSGAPWCTILFRYPTRKLQGGGGVKSGEHGGQLTDTRGEMRRPSKWSWREPGQVIAGCSCVNRWSIFLNRLLVECAGAIGFFRVCKKPLNTARYRRVMTVTVSPAEFSKKIGTIVPCAFVAHQRFKD